MVKLVLIRYALVILHSRFLSNMGSEKDISNGPGIFICSRGSFSLHRTASLLMIAANNAYFVHEVIIQANTGHGKPHQCSELFILSGGSLNKIPRR